MAELEKSAHNNNNDDDNDDDYLRRQKAGYLCVNLALPRDQWKQY